MSEPLLQNLREVGRRLAEAPTVLLCLDYDGTLTPLVDDPAQAVLHSEARSLLRELSSRSRFTVAIVSGRARADLQAQVGLPGLIYAGNHGFEISGPGLLFVEPSAVTSRAALQAVADDLTARMRNVSGAWVEDKGLTLTVHFRAVAPSLHDEVRRLVHTALAGSSHPFQLTAGHQVFEIRPRTPWHKGMAISWILEQLKLPAPVVVYVGDDATDEDAFAYLSDQVTVKVGGAATAAAYHLDNTADVHTFLRWLRQAPHLNAA